MGLSSGTKLGPYEILSPLGAGGMGEVYRARDTKLGRDVALKVLPEAFAQDLERMGRFQREAQVLASLNHSSIASIYGLEDAGKVRALVMELVEGPTLAERLKSGAMPVEEALPVARQIAEALEAAHERGIIHRDLKPANIKLTPDGAVKVLDFGLAKALETQDSAANLTNSPTMMTAATQAGVILGTAAYMSPEQAKGKSVDRRADIWAFGCVLYEMLSGVQTFSGETVTDVLAAVVRAEPDWQLLPPTVSPRLRDLVQRCLTKDSKRRLQAIGDARITLEELQSGADSVAAVSDRRHDENVGDQRSPLQRALPWGLAGLLVVTSVLLGLAFVLRKPAQSPSISASINLPGGDTQGPGSFSISPDGRRLAVVGASPGGRPQLWVRPLDSLGAQALAGTEDALYPFWSPDNRYIGFFADGKLKKIEASGGPAQTICDAPEGRGGTWGPDGIIAFAPVVFTGIFRVADTGGTPTALTPTPEAGDSDRFPSFMPDGKHVLFLSLNAAGKKNHVRAVSLDGKEVKTIGEIESNAVYDSAGYLLYERDGNLVAQRLDQNTFTLSGDAVPIVEKIEFVSIRGNASFSISSDGILIYNSVAEQAKVQLTWFDRDGKRLGTLGDPGRIFMPSISPDGKKVITSITADSGRYSLWMFDVARGISSRFTFTDSNDDYPVWSPDGKQVAFSMSRSSGMEVYVKPTSGVESQRPLVTGEGESMPTDWSHDGRFIAYKTQSRATKKFDIWVLPTTGDRKPFPFIATDADEEDGVFSPDGRWMAYVSDESGRKEIYVVPFPGKGGKWQISSSGGEHAYWPSSGTELDYLTPDRKWIAVEVNGKGNDFAVGSAKALFGGKPVPESPIFFPAESPDGKKLLIPIQEETASAPLEIVTNWRAAIKK